MFRFVCLVSICFFFIVVLSRLLVTSLLALDRLESIYCVRTFYFFLQLYIFSLLWVYLVSSVSVKLYSPDKGSSLLAPIGNSYDCSSVSLRIVPNQR